MLYWWYIYIYTIYRTPIARELRGYDDDDDDEGYLSAYVENEHENENENEEVRGKR